MKKLIIYLSLLLIASLPFKSIAQDSNKNPTNPKNVTGPTTNIECPNVDNKIFVVCLENNIFLPDSEIGKIAFMPSIKIDWKKYVPKEILNFDPSNPNPKVIGRLRSMNKYDSMYYSPIKLDNISKYCFHYYLLTDAGIYNLKPIKLMGMATFDNGSNKFSYFNGSLISEIINNTNAQMTGIGLGIISKEKQEFEINKIDVLKDVSLMNKIKTYSEDFKNWVESENFRYSYRLKIKGENKNYLFLAGMERYHPRTYDGIVFIENNNLEQLDTRWCFFGEP